MFNFLISTAHAQATEAASSGGAPGYTNLIPFVLMIVVFYFFLIRPQAKQQKALKKMISELKIGDDVVMASGIHGKVTAVKDAELDLKIASNVEITVDRQAVQSKKARTQKKT